MEDVKQRIPNWCKALIVGLSALCLVLSCVAFQSRAQAQELSDTVSSICAGSIRDIEMELRSQDPQLGKNLYQFYTITRVYPTTSYAELAESLLVLEDQEQLGRLTAEQRSYIADGLRAFLLDEQIPEREEYLTGIDNLMTELTLQK